MAVKIAPNLKSTPQPESSKEYPRIGVVDKVDKNVVSMSFKTLIKFTLNVSVYTIKFDSTNLGGPGNDLSKFSYDDLRIGTQYPYLTKVVPKFKGINVNEFPFDFSKFNTNSLKKPILFAETLTFQYFNESNYIQ